MRIDKVLESQKVGSKKFVKRLFQRGVVQVDGKVITDPSFNIDTRIHHVEVDGKQIARYTHRYYLLNKPNGVVTARKDGTHTTVLDLIRQEDRTPDLYPVGRLDRDTEGLLLVTDNGQLGYQLLLPDKKVAKTYEAIVNERVTEEDVLAFKEGIEFIGGVVCQPAELVILEAEEGRSLVHLTIQEGKFHQVKKMFLACGKKVIGLKRISFGPLQLDETLEVGEYRSLHQQEMAELKPYFCGKDE